MKTKSIKKCVIGCCCTILGSFWTFGSLPTANYPLDEGSGTNTYDASGNGLTAATTNSAPGWQPPGGMIAGTVQFTPTNQNDVHQAFAYNAPGNIVTNYPFTLSAWMKVSTVQSYTRECVFLGDGATTANYFALGVAANSGTVANLPTVVSRVGTGGPISIYGNAIATDGQWHNIVGVFNSSSNKTIYVDGISNATDAVNVFPLTNDYPNRIGLGALTRLTPLDAFDGYLDDVGVWTGALTPQKVALINGLGRVEHIGLTNSAINSLLAVYNKQIGSVTIGKDTWGYATNLTGGIGATGGDTGSGYAYIILGTNGSGVQIFGPAPIAYYSLDETSGTNAHDSSSDGWTATTTNSNPLWLPSSGKIGGTLQFAVPNSQTSTYQTFNYNTSGYILTNYPFTMAAWVKVSTGQSYTREYVFLGNSASSANYFALGIAGDTGGVANTPTIVSRSGGGPGSAYGSAAITDGQWHYIVGVFNSSSNKTIYVDGISNFTDAVSVFALTNNFPNRISLGALMRSAPTDAYDGLLDDVGIWSLALTSQQIALYNGLGKFSYKSISNAAVDPLLALYDAHGGSLTIGTNIWTYATNLTGAVGSTGYNVSLGGNYIVLGLDGTGVLMSAPFNRPLIIPNSPVTYVDELGAYAFGYQLRGQSDQYYPLGWFGYQDSAAGLSCQPYGSQYGQIANLMTPPLYLGAGLSFQEFYVQLTNSATNILLTGSTALLSASVGESDGVTFRVFANGNKLLEVNQANDVWRPFSLSLSDYAGGNVLLRYEVDCGTNNNNANDYGLWTGRTLVIQGTTFNTPAHPAPPALVLTNLYPVQNSNAAPLSGFAGSDSWGLTNQVGSLKYSGPDGTLAYTWRAPQFTSDSALGQISLAAQRTNDMTVPTLPVATNALFTWTQPATLQSAVFQTNSQGVLLTETYAVGTVTATVSIQGQMVGKSLMMTIACGQPVIEQFNTGMWGPGIRRRMIQQPNYTDPVHYFPDQNVFASVIPDWTYSAASALANPLITYTPLANGVYNNFSDRIIYTAAWHMAEVFPNIPNPVSPYRATLANRMVIGMGIDHLDAIANNLTNLADYGITNCSVICHAWQWDGYDNGYPKFYPCGSGYGGEPAAIYMGTTLKNLGMLFALHVNYVNYFDDYPSFSTNDVCLNSQGNPVNGGTWDLESPDAMVRLAGTQEPYITTNYHATACYMDVHTAEPPWGQVDYRVSSTNAGMFRENWNQTRQLFNYERTTHNGPVFGEGSDHWYYSGCLDAVETQYGNSTYPSDAGFGMPLLVDFNLLKIHPLQFNHGQYLNRWWPTSYNNTTNTWFTNLDGSIPQVILDQDRMQKVIFGHAGYLGLWREYTNLPIAWQEYHLLTPVTAQYGNAQPVAIDYWDGTNWVDTDAILKSHVYLDRAQVTYGDGLEITVNANTNNLTVSSWTLPQYGWLAQGAGLTNTGTVLRQGIMTDSADTGNSLFVNARYANDNNFGLNTAFNDADLNTNGTVIDFGVVQSDGSAWMQIIGTNWVMTPYPRTRNFTINFNPTRFGTPTNVTCIGGTTNHVTPVTLTNGWWNLPLNGSKQYAWSTNGATQLYGGVMLVKNILSPSVVMLTTQTKDHQVEISWPSSVAGATLLSTTNLMEGAWEAVTNVVNTNSDESSITIPIGDGRRFFRLKTN